MNPRLDRIVPLTSVLHNKESISSPKKTFSAGDERSSQAGGNGCLHGNSFLWRRSDSSGMKRCFKQQPATYTTTFTTASRSTGNLVVAWWEVKRQTWKKQRLND
jgi:hypothetical protein